MRRISNIISDINAWINAGTGNEVFIKKLLVVCLTLLVLYNLGYAIGVFLADIGIWIDNKMSSSNMAKECASAKKLNLNTINTSRKINVDIFQFVWV